MAMKYIALKDGISAATAREISEQYNIPYTLLAKILQKLSKLKLLHSHQGVKGGYILSKSAEDISLAEIINAIEPDNQLTECLQPSSFHSDCTHLNRCVIRDPLSKLNFEIKSIFNRTKLAQIL
ncbi:MAG: hypothetical protein Kow0098_09280 [Ignavibacteriaceae bacterium]